MSGGVTPELRAVSVVRDATDLLALPALLLAWMEARRHQDFTTRVIDLSPPARKHLSTAALIVAGVASLATSPPPPPGVVTDLETSASIRFSKGDVVTVRELRMTVAPNPVDESVVISLSALALHPDARTALVGAEVGTLHHGSRPIPGEVSLTLARCDHYPCTGTATLILELAEPAPAPVSVQVDVTASARTSAEELVVPSDALSVTGLEDGVTGPPPHIASGEIDGELTIDPDHPVVEQPVMVHLDPGTVEDGRLMFTETRLFVASRDTDDAATVSVHVDRLPSPAELSREPVDLLMPALACPPVEACDLPYVVRFVAGPTLPGPTRVSWRMEADLIDYGADTPPVGRSVELEAGGVTSVPDDARVLTRAVSGQLVVEHGRHIAGQRFQVVLNEPLVRFARGDDQRLVISKVLTVTAQEVKGPDGRAVPLRLRDGSEFSADGKPHVIAFHDVTSCGAYGCQSTSGELGYAIYPSLEVSVANGAGAGDFPITVDWTMDVRIRSFGESALPENADLGVTLRSPRP